MRPYFASLAVIAAFVSSPALAEEGVVGELVRIEVEKGGVEAEARATFIDLPGQDEFGFNAAIGYGLTDNLQLRGEIATGGSDFDRKVEAVIVSLRWKIVDPDNAPVGFAIQPGLVIDPDTGNIGSETFVILEHRGDDFDLIGNLLIGTEPGDWGEVGVSYASRAETLVGPSLAMGVELGGTVSGEGEGSHFAGPVATLSVADGGPSIGLGIFGGLTGKAPDFQARLNIEAEF